MYFLRKMWLGNYFEEEIKLYISDFFFITPFYYFLYSITILLTPYCYFLIKISSDAIF